MNKQRGFVLMTYAYIAAGVVALGLVGAVYVQTLRLGTCKAEFATFVGGVDALGKAAEKASQDKAMRDKLFKENADAENTRTVAALRATVKRLRDASPSGSFVPAAPAGASRPDLACFDRAEYQRADGGFTEGARGLADEGTAATVNLNTAKDWARTAP